MDSNLDNMWGFVSTNCLFFFFFAFVFCFFFFFFFAFVFCLLVQQIVILIDLCQIVASTINVICI